MFGSKAILGATVTALLVAAIATAATLAQDEAANPTTASAMAGGSKTDRATGGGQILVGTRGAGDTIAFTAQGTADEAKGQVQYQDRTDGTGKDHVTYHGEVACLAVEGNTARISGTWRDGGIFQLFVVDNGEGANAENDVVVVMSMADDVTCDFDEPEDEDQTALARGNAQVYDAP